MPWTANDCRHLPTVIGGIFSAAAICWLFDPSAAAKTMRLRRANDCGVEEERTSLSGHRPTVPEVHYTIKNYPYDVLVRAFSIYVYTFHAIILPAGRGEAQVQAYSQDLRERVLRAPGARGSSDGDCAALRGEPHWGLSGARPGARDGSAHQSSDRRPSPVPAGGNGTGAARLDRSPAGSYSG